MKSGKESRYGGKITSYTRSKEKDRKVNTILVSKNGGRAEGKRKR